MNRVAVAFMVAACALAVSSAPVATQVTLVLTAAEGVKVSYSLSEDAIVTVDFLTNGVSVGGANMADVGGDVNKVVAAGLRKITWRPDRTPGVARQLAAGELTANLTVWPKSSPPDYMAVDLMVTNAIMFYASSNTVPGGVTSRQYKTTKLLMRRIPAGGVEWRMGINTEDTSLGARDYAYAHYVKLSEDFYIGVYELTLKQANCINKRANSNFTSVEDYWVLPMEGLSWQEMRGYKNWPAEGHDVGEGCLLDAFRKWTGLELDLPTDAQWEFACRAGTSTQVYWGDDVTTAKVLSMCRCGGSSVTSPVEVGSYPPNPWGLYDMLGNMNEECLDYCCWGSKYKATYNDSPETAVTDPKGPTAENCNVTVVSGVKTNLVRVARGGVFSEGTNQMLSWRKSGTNVHESNTNNRWIGFRLACPMPFR